MMEVFVKVTKRHCPREGPLRNGTVERANSCGRRPGARGHSESRLRPRAATSLRVFHPRSSYPTNRRPAPRRGGTNAPANPLVCERGHEATHRAIAGSAWINCIRSEQDRSFRSQSAKVLTSGLEAGVDRDGLFERLRRLAGPALAGEGDSEAIVGLVGLGREHEGPS